MRLYLNVLLSSYVDIVDMYIFSKHSMINYRRESATGFFVGASKGLPTMLATL